MALLAVKDRTKDYIERGSDALQQDNHPDALLLYKQALHALREDNVPDPALELKVYFRLTTIELDISCSKDMSTGDQIKHHRQAEEYSAMTLTAARAIPTPGVLEQARLERSFVRGRKVRLEEKKRQAGKAGPMNAEDIKREKREARKEMERAMFDLRAADPGKSVGYEKRVGTGLERLS